MRKETMSKYQSEVIMTGLVEVKSLKHFSSQFCLFARRLTPNFSILSKTK
jgi:hypothetical protein